MNEQFITDSDCHFILDPITKQLTTNSKKNVLVQGDHNSERFTFELPRYIEGYDLLECNIVQVHYINEAESWARGAERNVSADVYESDDICIFDEERVTFSWLISSNATKYAGSLSFVITLKWVDTTTFKLKYAYNSEIYKGITISPGIDNGEPLANDNYDILASWEDEIKNDMKKWIDDKIYCPDVNEFYITANATSPAEKYGGTWERIEDRFLLASGDTYAAGSTGGEADVTLTAAQMPTHGNHLVTSSAETVGLGSATSKYLLPSSMNDFGTQGRGWNSFNSEIYPAGISKGGGKSHNNMPPYLTVYIWKRIA